MLPTQKINTITIVFIAVTASLVAVTAIYRRQRRRTTAVNCSDSEEKPQSRFKRVFANNSYSPFKHFKRLGNEKEISLKAHPFEEEVRKLIENPPSLIEFVKSDGGLEMSDSYVWVETKEELELVVEALKKERAFGVDTEQHSLRSFLGFTALMQISTQKEDFLLDTIALHDEMGMLRDVFADPSICKVFHGADNDVLWLQRDYHIYVVNLFDTAKACEVLSKPQKSLAYLLETYCGVSTDKTFQREDWRLRPLSPEMIQYARTDAHYLLYIANCLASELRQENQACLDDELNLFLEASRRSNLVCMQLYAKDIEPTPGASAAASIYSRNLHLKEYSSLKSSETKELIWKLCAWRDLMARVHDESLRYVLSDQSILCLATKVPKAPREVFSIIHHADLSTESSNIRPSLPSPYHIISSHVNEICFLLQEVDANINDILKRYLQKHLGPGGCCSISIYNYALLSEFNLKESSAFFPKQNGRRFTPIGKKASRELFVQKFSCKSPVYHNCRIYANDGRLLCYCDRRKLEWYLRRDLAKIVEDDPPAIMLLFEPKGRPEDEDNDFYIQSKKNICVGCGEKNHYLRYRIIPSCYRMHFPEHLKSHRSHDIVLLCVDCHEVAHSAAEKYKRQIAAEFGIPLFVRKIVNSGETKIVNLMSNPVSEVEETGVSPLQLRIAAMALLRHGSTMPSGRRDELMQTVKSYFGGREITQEDLEMALLVGMSPHEIRRLEKKKGLNLKRYKDSGVHVVSKTSTVQTNGCASSLNDVVQNSEESSETGDVNDIDIEGTTVSVIDGNEQNFDGVETSNIEGDSVTSHDNGCGNPSDESTEYHQSEVLSSRSAKKLSLLGHGPHGKQVVDHILNNYGEDGVSQFCQRWRHVFVEAIHPRFLPSGWDVLHSGRREFGDYSVYNPAKKESQDDE